MSLAASNAIGKYSQKLNGVCSEKHARTVKIKSYSSENNNLGNMLVTHGRFERPV